MSRGLNLEQLDYLEESVGKHSINIIATKLGKKVRSLEMYRKRRGIPSSREAADGISVTLFAETVGRCAESVYDWIEKQQLPVKKIPIGSKKEMFIDLDKFWPWAWQHKYFIDFSIIEEGSFGVEPDWVKDLRKMDMTDWGKKGWDRPWTPAEDTKLRNLLRLQKYTYRQLADMIQRTELAIQGRLYQINEKFRPMPEPRRVWSPEETIKFEKLYEDGYSVFQISRILDRNELQVKAKIVRLRR